MPSEREKTIYTRTAAGVFVVGDTGGTLDSAVRLFGMRANSRACR